MPDCQNAGVTKTNARKAFPPSRILALSHLFLWAHLDLNQGPTDYESAALTTELWARLYQTAFLEKSLQIYIFASNYQHPVAFLSSRMSLIKNIIFDYGGVILNIDYNRTVKAFKNLGFLEFDQLYSKAIQTDLFDKLEKGLITAEDFYGQIRLITGPPLKDQQIETAWNAIILDMPPDRIQLLEKVKKHYRIFLLSNTNEIHNKLYSRLLLENYGYTFEDLFEKAYFSYQIGMIKPDPAIFERVLRDNGLGSRETLFIDDSIQHIRGAEKTGIHTFFLGEGTEITSLFDTATGRLAIQF